MASHAHMMFRTYLYKVDDGDETYLVAARSRKEALGKWAAHVRAPREWARCPPSCRLLRQTKGGVSTWRRA